MSMSPAHTNPRPRGRRPLVIIGLLAAASVLGVAISLIIGMTRESDPSARMAGQR